MRNSSRRSWRKLLEDALVVLNVVAITAVLVAVAATPSSWPRRKIAEALERRGQRALLDSLWPSLVRNGLRFDNLTTQVATDTIVVFSDYECPYCRQLHESLVHAEASGRLPVVLYRQFPMPYHQNAKVAASLALCAEQVGEFREVHDYLMESDWWMSAADGRIVDTIASLAGEGVRVCLTSGGVLRGLATDSALAAALDLIATPTLVTGDGVYLGKDASEWVQRRMEDSGR